MLIRGSCPPNEKMHAWLLFLPALKNICYNAYYPTTSYTFTEQFGVRNHLVHVLSCGRPENP